MISRAGRLIRAALDSSEVSADALAKAVGISSLAINEVRLGEAMMPLSQQLRLARFLIATSPQLRGPAHALEAQALAATGFDKKSVRSQSGSPTTGWSSRKRKS